jgi:hypothetical protein
MSILVRVTQEDIDQGIRLDPARCPIAWALRRKTGNRYLVWPMCHAWASCITRRCEPTAGEKPACALPPTAARFAHRFDDGKPVKPFAFRLKALPED